MRSLFASYRPLRASSVPTDRLSALFAQQRRPVAKLLRRLGVRNAEADDAMQEVFIVAAKRLYDIEPGRDRAFIFATAARIAANARRRARNRREELVELDVVDRSATPEERVARSAMFDLAARLVDAMPTELRTVFLLHEIEELSVASIAGRLRLPEGTVASRLRRARAVLHAGVDRALPDCARR